jgi:2-hydroxychromene-2-carboxylate isomerase
MAQPRIRVYSDYQSPYAYLAKDLVYELECETGVTLDWLPYTLDIPAYLGSAKVDSDGNVVEASRNAHQWRRVKYSYMDCRREANRRGLTILGPRKIFDSSLANACFMPSVTTLSAPTTTVCSSGSGSASSTSRVRRRWQPCWPSAVPTSADLSASLRARAAAN